MTAHMVPALDLPGQAASTAGPLNLNMNYLFHYAFRRDLTRLLDALVDLEPGDRARAAALRTHFTAMMAVLYEHHSGEDEFIWPVVREQNPDLAPLLDTMEAEHAALAPSVWHALQSFDALADDPTAAAIDETEDALHQVVRVLVDHLDHEESETVPLLQQRLSPTTWKEIERKFQRRGSLKMARFMVPWLMDNLTDEQLTQARSVVAPPLRVMWRVTRSEYARYSHNLWRSPA